MAEILEVDEMEVDEGRDGRTYLRGPVPLDQYYKLPEKSEPSAGGDWFTKRRIDWHDWKMSEKGVNP